MIKVIAGPPCAGKTTYLQKNAPSGSLVIDADVIAKAFGSGKDHGAEGAAWDAALIARRAVIDYVLRSNIDAWIIDSLPSDASMKRYEKAGAEIILLDPGAEVCAVRAEERPEGTKQVINHWYENAGVFLSKYAAARRKTANRSGSDPRQQSVADERNHMKRTDITALFPDATDEQIKTIMDLNGADINKAKGDLDDLKGQLSNAQKELEGLKAGSNEAALQAANEKAAALQNELDSLKHANTIRDIRDKVAGETKVPAALLTGETEEACASQAKAILEFAKNNQGYPIIKDGGEAAAGKTGRTESAWQQFASQISK